MGAGYVIGQDELREHTALEVHTVGFREFAPAPDCVAEVRDFVEEILFKAGVEEDVVFESKLVADELAANAVRHAGSMFSVGIELTTALVRIAVRDESQERPVQQSSAPEAQSGRGLVIVSGTASGWGTVPLGRGKEIWADVVRAPD